MLIVASPCCLGLAATPPKLERMSAIHELSATTRKVITAVKDTVGPVLTNAATAISAAARNVAANVRLNSESPVVDRRASHSGLPLGRVTQNGQGYVGLRHSAVKSKAPGHYSGFVSPPKVPYEEMTYGNENSLFSSPYSHNM